MFKPWMEITGQIKTQRKGQREDSDSDRAMKKTKDPNPGIQHWLGELPQKSTSHFRQIVLITFSKKYKP